MDTANNQSLKPNGNRQGKITKKLITDSERHKIINAVNRRLNSAKTFDEMEEALRRVMPFVRYVKADRQYREHYPQLNTADDERI